jgi:outer membrane immunogenic protein
MGLPMKKILLAYVTLAGLCMANPVLSADLGTGMPVKAPPAAVPPPPVFTWTGFYFGGHVGYLWGHTRIVEVETGTIALGPTNGVVGGVLGGVNWQTGPLVLGIEGDIGWSNAHGNGVIPTGTEFFQYKISSTGHARGRAGYDFGGTLVYVAGGLAVARAHVQEIDTTTSVICQAPGGTYTGGSIGGGVEHAFTRQILARIEYLYDDFGHKTYTMMDDVYRVGITGSTVRGAVVFKFWP